MSSDNKVLVISSFFGFCCWFWFVSVSFFNIQYSIVFTYIPIKNIQFDHAFDYILLVLEFPTEL